MEFTIKVCNTIGDFSSIPSEVYNIIINYMQDPLILSLVNKELYYLMNKSVYGKCYYKEFKYNNNHKLIAKEYAYVTILVVLWSDISDSLLLMQFINLLKLDCSHCENITDKSIIELKQLQKLYCCCCKNITDKSIIELKQLQELCCWDCPNITDKSIIELKQLQILHCWDCPNITDKSIIELKKINPKLKIYR